MYQTVRTYPSHRSVSQKVKTNFKCQISKGDFKIGIPIVPQTKYYKLKIKNEYLVLENRGT